MSDTQGPVHIVSSHRYEELLNKEERLRRLVATPLDIPAQRQAEVFMRHLDLDRVDEWGHIAYCMERAFEQRLADTIGL